MSLIEQAAKRLEDLRRAGAALPGESEDGAAAAEPPPGQPAARGGPGEALAPVPLRAAPPPPSRYVEIDLARLKARGFVTPDSPSTQIADEYRVIKRPIIQNALGKGAPKVRNGNLVMVTSSLPGEGKTFTALNLALSIAMEVDTTVLLVDGDVANPALPEPLGIPTAPGLLDLLTGEKTDVNDALIRTNVEKLTVLPAGAPQRRATELLASEQMVQLLQELAGRSEDRIVIFDSPPLLATTEARVLASHMGQIIMVVAADSTTHGSLTQALATIENCDVVMMMLNKAAQTDVGAHYGYYRANDRAKADR